MSVHACIGMYPPHMLRHRRWYAHRANLAQAPAYWTCKKLC